MTHPISEGTVNITINVTEAEARLLGRLACDQDRSRGNLLKRAWAKGLEDENPEAAAEIKRIRESWHKLHHHGQTMGLIVMTGWLAAMAVGGACRTERQGRTLRPARQKTVQRVVRRRAPAGIYTGGAA